MHRDERSNPGGLAPGLPIIAVFIALHSSAPTAVHHSVGNLGGLLKINELE